ncbi:glycerol-3-phosphate acyltransferase [Planococcus glaciei]|uniref:Glycerol-3-phosphate acyltransferase n=1 Tax=Planococcus glaciei TaxID=459472 RepID=A0A7H8QD87_9BACL|nr:glycerol-3-phosphate 1-O-acyltransferase PlsY [Planococcus glaciei]ETP67951.1 glycerol-3-phosphate acyltransferase [Planococcus glaciei CHR43]KOF09603.1 glycerol-3-phosphate acyltransferase [Planococcus glaciei]MBX0314872.1 glycerol-3-phosphate 1-O-acyltransferase PlsY [Planococcus glaciei]QDY46366.1 glycerol-3-phosphate 1-O-acyltransferase PlsY [Planococcus glaciei]QKX51917.1 glycerol-3-phosphate 1-O-acyltransferase PlsY [Planococcus glaciei]
MNTLLPVLLAYLLGSIPSALWIGKIFYNTDIRTKGSGNLGATNTFRTLGAKAGIVVTVLDILKGTAATLIPLYIDTNIHPLIFGVIAVVGHMFPVFAKFKGGKAVATSGGILLGYQWPLFLVAVAVLLITLKITKMVSLSSIILAVVAVIYTTIYAINTGDYLFLAVIIVLASFIIYRHRANIGRIKAGTEPKIKW